MANPFRSHPKNRGLSVASSSEANVKPLRKSEVGRLRERVQLPKYLPHPDKPSANPTGPQDTVVPSDRFQMSACSLFERISVISNAMDNFNLSPTNPKRLANNPSLCTPSIPPGGPGPGPGGGPINGMSNGVDLPLDATSVNNPALLERDYYGCYCLKFIVKNGSHITEEKVQQDFGQLGEVVDVRGPGLFSGLRGNHVYVRYIEKADAEEALRQLAIKYHQLTPASISDVLPDNYGLYTISFYNKTGIPSVEVRKEFSKFGEVKNLTGSLDVKGGRVFVSYKEKVSAVQALQAFFFRKDRYPNMKFALPRCEKDYFGCYCLKFYNKSADVNEDIVMKDFGQFGEVVDVRGPGLFDVTGDDVYVRYKEKSSAEQALIELVGRYDSLCLAPPSDIQADKFGYFTITFVNDKCLSKSDVWYIFSKFGTVACVNGTFDCKKGRVFVSYKEKQGALNALETMLITKEYHLQVSKNSTVRKNDYNVVGASAGPKEGPEVSSNDYAAAECSMPNGGIRSNNSNVVTAERNNQQASIISNNTAMTNGAISNAPAVLNNVDSSSPNNRASNGGTNSRELSRSRESSLLPSAASINHGSAQQVPYQMDTQQQQPSNKLAVSGNGSSGNMAHQQGNGGKNGLVKFNRNVEKDIFGYFCLSFLNEDGDINEKKVRHDFGKFGEVVSVRGALGKQKGHVFVRFRRKEAAENCLNCLNSFPLSEMSELFGKYLFLSPATPRDIDCDMYGLYSISFLNLNMKTFREIRQEFSKFGDIVRLTSGGGGNTDELVSISYAEKLSAVKALQNHFTNKEFPYLDIAKGSSLLLVNSSDSSDNEDNESDYIHHHRELQRVARQQQPPIQPPSQQAQHSGNKTSADPFHDPPKRNGLGGSDVVDELLKPLQSYFNIYRTGQYGLHGELALAGSNEFPGPQGNKATSPSSGTPGSGPSPFIINRVSSQPALGTTSASSPSSLPGSGNRSPDKKYRIKSVKQHQQPPPPPINGKRSSSVIIENGQTETSTPSQDSHFTVPPPPTSNIIPNRTGMCSENIPGKPAATHHAMIPNLSSLSSTAISQQTSQDTKITKPSKGQHLFSPKAATGSSKAATSSPSSVQASPEREIQKKQQNQMQKSAVEPVEMVAALSNNASASKSCSKDGIDNISKETKEIEDVDQAESASTEVTVEPDLIGFYSLSFCNKSKELTDRKIRQDFGSENVVRVRGLAGLSKNEIGNGEVITVSFENQDMAVKQLKDTDMHRKYPGLTSTSNSNVKPDKEGAYSIEFINSGMSGIREITNEFSRHGEVVKVMAGGAKNAVKRVTVSYADKQSALSAVKAHGNSKDYVSLYFARECLDADF